MHATTGDPQPVASSPPLLPDPNRHIVHVVRVLNDATLLAVVGDTFFIHDHLRAAEGRFTSPRPWTPGQHSGGVVVGRDRVVTPGWLFAADQHSDLIALLGSLHGLLVVDQFPLSAEDATLPCQLERDVLGILDKLRPFRHWPEPVANTHSPTVRIVRYSDLLVAVFGDTTPVEHVLKELHGEPASHLTLGGLLARGWLFHVQTLIDRGVDLGFLLKQHPEVHVEDDLGPLGAVVGPGRGRPLVTGDGYSPQAAAGQAPSHRVDLVRLHAQTVVVFPSGPTWDHVLLSLHGIRVEQVWNGVLRQGFAFRGEDHDKVAAALTAVGVDVVDDIMAAEWAAADAAAAAVAAAGHAHGTDAGRPDGDHPPAKRQRGPGGPDL